MKKEQIQRLLELTKSQIGPLNLYIAYTKKKESALTEELTRYRSLIEIYETRRKELQTKIEELESKVLAEKEPIVQRGPAQLSYDPCQQCAERLMGIGGAPCTDCSYGSK